MLKPEEKSNLVISNFLYYKMGWFDYWLFLLMRCLSTKAEDRELGNLFSIKLRLKFWIYDCVNDLLLKDWCCICFKLQDNFCDDKMFFLLWLLINLEFKMYVFCFYCWLVGSFCWVMEFGLVMRGFYMLMICLM